MTTQKSFSLPTYWVWILGIFAFFVFLYLIKAILLPFVLGLLMAYFLDPAADKLEAWKFPRGVATAFIIVVFFGAFVAGIMALAPLIYGQAMELIHLLPQYIAKLQTTYLPQLEAWLAGIGQPADIKENLIEKSSDISRVAGTFFSGVLQSGMTLVNLLSLLVITPVVAFYLLRDWDRMVAQMDDLLPRKHASTIREQCTAIDHTLAGFIRGQINVSFLLGLFYAIFLSVAGLPFAIAIGVMAGVLIIIPYAGTVLSGVIAVGVAYMHFDALSQVALVFGIFVIGQMLEGYVLTPKLIGNRVGLHPVWIIFGMLAGGALFGFVGIFLAVPVTAVIGVLVRFATERYRESHLYQAN